MPISKGSKDLPAFGIYEDLFHLVFKGEGENIVNTKPDLIKQEKMALLLAWPGILMIHLVAKIHSDTKYQKSLNELIGMLNDDTDSDQIRGYLDTIIEFKKIPKTFIKDAQKALIKLIKNNSFEQDHIKRNDPRYLLKISKTLFIPRIINILSILLLLPKIPSFESNINMSALSHSLSNYYVLCCMIIRCLERNDGDTYITDREMKEGYYKCGLQKQLNVYYISRISSYFLESIINDQTHNLSEFSLENKDLESLDFSKICTPSIKMSFHRILPENTIAYINEFVVDSDKLILDRNINGIGYNISRDFGYDNDLWRLISSKNPELNGYLFFNEKNDLQDVLPALIKGLHKSARQSAIEIKSIISSWGNFINDPNEDIKENPREFKKWSDSLSENYEVRDEFFKLKPVSRIFGDIDSDIDDPNIDKLHDEYRKAKYNHIPIELWQKLIEAKDELYHFKRSVIKEKKYYDETQALKYFDENRSKYTYLDLLEHDNIKEIIFSTDRTADRNNWRKILPIINEKLGGKPFKESTLTKLLDLESGEGKYLKYARYNFGKFKREISKKHKK